MTDLSEARHAAVAEPPSPVALPLSASEAMEESRDLLGAAFSDIFALDDLVRRYPQSPFTAITMRGVIGAVCERLSRVFDTCIEHLGQEHVASRELAEAQDALEGIDELLLAASDGADGVCIRAEVISVALRAFVVRTAQAMERAEIGCGASVVTVGYLEHPDHDANRPDPHAEAEPRSAS